MDEKKKILTENFKEYFDLAVEAFRKGKYNSATTLFFKAIIALCDLCILEKEGFVPSSHSNRFRTLEKKFPEIYRIIDRDFPFYQDSYTKKMSKDSAKLLKEDAESIKKNIGI